MATKQAGTYIDVTCERGHRTRILVEEGRDPAGNYVGWNFVGDLPNGPRPIPSPDSYAYTYGGCCYRAAVDAASELEG